MIRADFGKANMIKFALSDELGYDAGALLEGNALNDTCGLKQVKLLGPAELGEDEIDLAFECCLSAAQVSATIHVVRDERPTNHHMD